MFSAMATALSTREGQPLEALPVLYVHMTGHPAVIVFLLSGHDGILLSHNGDCDVVPQSCVPPACSLVIIMSAPNSRCSDF